MIRDGHSVGIAGQVLKHMLGPAKGSLGINHPVFPKQGAQESCECLLIRQRLTFAKDGSTYTIENFSAREWDRWQSASSLGGYFNSFVRGNYGVSEGTGAGLGGGGLAAAATLAGQLTTPDLDTEEQ